MLLETRIPLTYVARKVRRDALNLLVITTLVELVVHFERKHLPEVPPSLPAFLGTAISLLLSFKLNQSYDRWWEARKVWGSIVNDSRTLVRQLLTFAPGEAEICQRLGRRQMAWCYALGQCLRGLDWRTGAVEHLSAAEIAEAERYANKPLALMQFHARDVEALARAGHLSDYRRIAVDDTLTRLVDSMGRAERIRNTVFPRTHRMFLHALIYMFVTFLALVLAEVDGAWGFAITFVVAIPFFLLEKTAMHMQDPFANRPTDTPCTAIARTVEIDLRQLLGDEHVPGPHAPDGFYLM